MNRKSTFKKGMAYIYMPLLFCLAGYCALYFAFSPILSPVLASVNLLAATSKTDYTTTVRTIFNGTDAVTNGAVKEADIQIPTYGTLYAKLEISAVSVNTDLYFGDSNSVLKRGVGQYIGTSIPGYGKPLLIGGHNNGPFNKLQYLSAGDTVTITTNYGKYKYKVTGTKIAQSNDKSAYNLRQNKEQLILYTCYPFNTIGLTSKRFFVYADKISGPVIESTAKG